MKRFGITAILALILSVLLSSGGLAQDAGKAQSVSSLVDSLAARGVITRIERTRPEIRLSMDEAIRYLQSKYVSGDWTNPSDPLRLALGNLIYYAIHPPFDTVRSYLTRYSFDSLNIPWDMFYRWDTIKMKVPVILPPQFISPADSLTRADTIGLAARSDTILIRQVNEFRTDSISAYRPELQEQTVILKDTLILVAPDTIISYLPYNKYNPFWVYRFPFQGDSLASAVNLVAGYLTERDSSMISFRGTGRSTIPVWLNSKSSTLARYWLKNEVDDSVTVWIGSTDRNTISLFLENGITFRRPAKQTNFSDARLNLAQVNTQKLQDVNKIYVKPNYWKVRAETNFILNQAFMSNWVKGGESSFSTAMDIVGFADYNNKQLKLISNNFIRLKYGLVMSEGTGVRKNLDLLETNSKLNHKAFGKFDFSGTMLFKTQISKGYSYSKLKNPERDTAILVSRLMNPAILTIGFGLDYKPNKTTSINVAPLSYKATFVPDTTRIDQTKYGVPSDQRSMHEPGASLQFTNEFKPFKTITMINRLQLFTNYINNPLNIDVDWEMILTAKLNWFTDVRLNTHIIYDDDTKTIKLDKDKTPVPGPDGKPRKTPRVQFKELLGFTFVFRF